MTPRIIFSPALSHASENCGMLQSVFQSVEPLISRIGSLDLSVFYGGRFKLFNFITKQEGLVPVRVVLSAILVTMLTLVSSGFSAVAQEKKDAPPASKQDAKPGQEQVDAAKLTPAEVIAEYAIFAYGGRKALTEARSSIQEGGTIRLATDQGDITGTYNLRQMRGEKSWQDLLRVDLDLTPPEEARKAGAPPSIKYIVAFNGATVWSAQNNQYQTPRPEVEAAFRAQLSHDYTTLLRYKEDGSTLEMVGPETVVGVETNVIDLTTTTGEKTRFWISKKFYRVVHIEYEVKLSDDQQPVKYRISYYYTPYKIVQNTLVPTRRVTHQDGKLVQEVQLDNINYSAKFEPDIFQHLP